jgi:hypothetical protein
MGWPLAAGEPEAVVVGVATTDPAVEHPKCQPDGSATTVAPFSSELFDEPTGSSTNGPENGLPAGSGQKARGGLRHQEARGARRQPLYLPPRCPSG